MDEIIETVERRYPAGSVLIACGTDEISTKLVEMLLDAGMNPVGISDRASIALTLAAQIPADVAVIETRLLGRRDGRELADQLRDTWGVPSLLIDRN